MLRRLLATEIPKDESSGFVGYVLRFGVRSEFLSHYEVHTVGSSEHREYWIPAADLEKLNENIVERSKLSQSFGPRSKGE